jgi:predicted DNA-binding transcriptional regulator YafY
MDRFICEAIKNKQIITFEYDNGIRTVEPFRLGMSTQHNNVLRAFQLKNASKPFIEQNWRLFDLSKIRRLELSGDIFNRNREGYGIEDKDMIKYICEVKFY